MNNTYNDFEYLNIIKNIINNNEYKEIGNCLHHGTSRLKHSLRVSYYSYKVAKLLNLDYKETAIGGLLHDFFITDNYNKVNKKVSSTFKHPKIALSNANEIFNITEKEQDIIVSHMFPVVLNKVPKYLESWIVSIVDKVVGSFEFIQEYQKLCKVKFRNSYVLLALFISKMI